MVRAARALTPEQLARLGEDDLAAVAHAAERVELEDPVTFSRRVLGLEPWSRQADVLRAVAEYDRVAVRSGHKIGKSTSAAALALWWFHTRPRGFVVMTSSTDDQVRLILWKELQRLWNASGGKDGPIGGEMHESHRVGLKSKDGRSIIGLGTTKTENMGGFSGYDLLFIVDEASGVEDAIFDAIEGNRAGGAKMVMFGNPTKQFGKFYEAFHSDGASWKQLHVSSEETPNVVSGEILVPGLATREYIQEKLAEYGRDSVFYMIRVRGDFPDHATDAVIGLDVVQASSARWREPVTGDGPLEVGVDPARFGEDESVIFGRRGNMAYYPVVLQGLDVVELSQKVADFVRRRRVAGERPVVRVDGGGVGGGVVDVLRRSRDISVVDVSASSSAGSEEHSRARDRLWFNLRDWLVAGGQVPDDKKLKQELAAPTYGFDLRNRIKVESKDDIRAKLRPRRSPDRADALALAVYRAGAGAQATWDAPPHLNRDYDPAAAAIQRRIDEICSGG